MLEKNKENKEDLAKEETPVEESAEEKTPVEEVAAEETPVEEAPVEESAEEKTPVEEVAAEETPVEEAPVEESTEEKTPVEEVAAEEDPVEEASGLKLPFIIGTKLGMTQIFSSEGIAYPVTVIQAGPCNITQLKTINSDGYNSIQLGYKNQKESKTTKPLLGHFNKNQISPKKYLKEFRINDFNEEYKVGSEINVSQFQVGDMLNVTGTSKGKGFAGHMKRHNFSGGRASHGKNSVMRKAGSVGAGTSPGRVWKGTRMAGRMGNDTVTIKNLELVRVNTEENLLFVGGAIPGSNNNVVYITKN